MNLPADFDEVIRRAVREGDREAAERLLPDAATKAREAGEPRRAIVALRALAQVREHAGDVPAAFRAYREAISVAEDLDDPGVLAHTLRHEGDLLRRAERYAEARARYGDALRLYRTDPTTAPGELANALRPTALVLEALGDPTGARSHWVEALALYEEAGVEAGVDECVAALARVDGSPSEE